MESIFIQTEFAVDLIAIANYKSLVNKLQFGKLEEHVGNMIIHTNEKIKVRIFSPDNRLMHIATLS